MSENRKLYVGNFPYDTTEDTLRELFADHGEVRSVRIITEDGRSKGFGFIEMMTSRDAEKVLFALDRYGFGGRQLRVAYANPRKERVAS